MVKTFRWRGQTWQVDPQELLDRAALLLERDAPPEALRYRDWAVDVGGKPVSVKWLFALITGAGYDEFITTEARRALEHIGIVPYVVSDEQRSKPSARRRVTSRPAKKNNIDNDAHEVLAQKIDQVRSFLRGYLARPSDEVLCDWVQFCYTFKLYSEAYQLFELIDRRMVNDWYYERTQRMARVCKMRGQ